MRAALLLACLFAVSADAPPPAKPVDFPPLSGSFLALPHTAIDGDTLKAYVLTEVRVRMYGIDAPEMKGETKAAGIASRDHLQGMLPGKPMRVEAHGKDSFGRHLWEIYDAEGKELGKRMLEAGKAKEYKP